MKIPRKKTSSKKNAAILVLLILVAASVLYVYRTASQQASRNIGPPTQSSSDKVSKDQVDSSTDGTPDTDTPSKSTPPTSQEPEPNTTTIPPSSNTVEAPLIERASQTGRYIKVVATLQNQSSGNCYLELTNGSSLLQFNTPVTVAPSYFSCAFSIPADKLPKAGSWNATVIHVLNDASKKSATQTIEVNL